MYARLQNLNLYIGSKYCWKFWKYLENLGEIPHAGCKAVGSKGMEPWHLNKHWIPSDSTNYIYIYLANPTWNFQSHSLSLLPPPLNLPVACSRRSPSREPLSVVVPSEPSAPCQRPLLPTLRPVTLRRKYSSTFSSPGICRGWGRGRGQGAGWGGSGPGVGRGDHP